MKPEAFPAKTAALVPYVKYAKEDFFVKDKKNTPQVLARRALLVLLDAAIVAFSFYFALLLRADGAVEAAWWPHNRELLYENLPWIVAVYIASFLFSGLYSVLWKYAGERDLMRQTGMTGENLLRLLERRLDNVVFRLGFASTRRDARQLVNHGHFTVNGKKVNIPSYLVKPGDVIAVREASRSSVKFSKLTGADAPLVTTPEWMERNKEALEGKILRMPERSDIEFEVEEHLIVELYSK